MRSRHTLGGVEVGFGDETINPEADIAGSLDNLEGSEGVPPRRASIVSDVLDEEPSQACGAIFLATETS